ncbi:MAG: hypothetical protein J0L84_02175 [Verrucomicrobia bacterium]|nr:hypothetical protein [Verrucomicrobiota bacterium]
MNTPPDLSLLHEDVRPYGEAVLTEFEAAGAPIQSHGMLETYAWNRWAGSRSTDELAQMLLEIRQVLFRPGRHHTESLIIEAVMRLKHPRKWRQRRSL